MQDKPRWNPERFLQFFRETFDPDATEMQMEWFRVFIEFPVQGFKNELLSRFIAAITDVDSDDTGCWPWAANEAINFSRLEPGDLAAIGVSFQWILGGYDPAVVFGVKRKRCKQASLRTVMRYREGLLVYELMRYCKPKPTRDERIAKAVSVVPDLKRTMFEEKVLSQPEFRPQRQLIQIAVKSLNLVPKKPE